MAEQEHVDAYMDTVRRLEPDIAMLDQDAALASIAISLKRIADTLDGLVETGIRAQAIGPLTPRSRAPDTAVPDPSPPG